MKENHNRSMSSSAARVACLAASAGCATSLAQLTTASGQVTYDTVALTGVISSDPRGTGIAGDVRFSAFGNPIIDVLSNVGFGANLTGTDTASANNTGVWAGTPSTRQLIIRKGQSAPGLDSRITLTTTGLNSLQPGAIAYTARLASTTTGLVDGTNDTALFVGSFASPTVIREGTVAPGVPESQGKYDTFVNASQFGGPLPTLTPNGRLLFGASLAGPGIDTGGTAAGNKSGVWAGTPTSFDLTARTGAAGPGPGVTADSYYGSATGVFNQVGVNSTGDVLARVLIKGAADDTSINDSNDNALLWNPGPSVVVIAREGDDVAAIPGAKLGSVGGGGFHASGKVAFSTLVTGDTVNDANSRALFTAAPGVTPAVVARQGSPALGAGLPADATYLTFNGPAVNGRGEAVFAADFQGTGIDPTNDSGLWAGTQEGTRLLAREGAVAPVGQADVFYATQTTNTVFAANDNGYVVFKSFLTGPVSNGDDQALFVADPTGVVSLIAREGMSFDVDPSAAIDERIIAGDAFNGFQGSRSTMEDGRMIFNNDNELALLLRFTDGSSGIFAFAVPEPTSLSLLAMGGAALLRRRR